MGKTPTARLPLGGDKTLIVTLHKGYAEFRTYPHGQSIYIPRNQLVKLIRWMIPGVRRMTHSWSVEAAIRRYAQAEADHQRELRELKRGLYRAQRPRRRRKRQRKRAS